MNRSISALILAATVACAPRSSVVWQAPEVISSVTDVGAAPMIAMSPTGARTVAWVSAPAAGTDGRLYVSTNDAPATELRDPEGGIEPHGEAPPKLAYGPDGRLYALYAVGRVEAGQRFPFTTLRLTSSTDGGRNWSTPATVTGDSVPRSRNFHGLHASADGALYVGWLESRGDSGSATYVTRSDDQGATWHPAVRVSLGESCPCCRVAMATTGNRVYLSWRAVLPGNVRDIVVARSEDRGATWSEPVRVHPDEWVFEGCPHAGPSLLIDATGALHVAWWTGKEGSSGTFYAKSTDGGRTFSPRVALGEAEYSRPAHVQLAMRDRLLVAAWDDGRDSLPRVMLRVSPDAGASFGPEVMVGEPHLATAFPVVALQDSLVTVAWSQRSAEDQKHSEHAAPDMKDPSSVMPLPSVGAQQVLVRNGVIR